MNTSSTPLRFVWLSALWLTAFVSSVLAETKVPSVFGNHMVLQRDFPVRVWGWDRPGRSVVVEFAGQKKEATASETGRWEVTLAPLKTSSEGRVMTVEGSTLLQLQDVLVGEVWLCSGQSNMQWSVLQSKDGDLETLAAVHPQIRLLTVPQVGTQEPQDDFDGAWSLCSSETIGHFSAVGYSFGCQLLRTLGVPVGLIDNAWGGSSAEAWVRRDALEQDEVFHPYLREWEKIEQTFDFEALQDQFQVKLAEWKEKGRKGRAPRKPRNRLTGQHRPGNLYAGVLHPIIGYGIRGVIWYQGESNSSRAWNYRKLFPYMIQHWRSEWGQGDFPFYWAQLADFREESPSVADSAWAELREAQTLTQSLPNTGQAVLIDLGEGKDIHPTNKQDVGKRLARWALAKDYGIEIAHRSPEYREMQVSGNTVTVSFDHVGTGLETFDTQEVQGFVLCGEDRVWHQATGKIVGKDRVQVQSPAVENPIAVRYAWADNPICNLQTKGGEELPVTPFRSDDFPLSTAPGG